MDIDLHLELIGDTFKLISTIFIIIILFIMLFLKIYNSKNDDRLSHVFRPDFYKFVLIPGIIILLITYGVSLFTSIPDNYSTIYYIALAILNPLTLYCVYIFHINIKDLSLANISLVVSYVFSYIFILLGGLFDIGIFSQLTTVFTMITIFLLTTNFVLYFFVEIENKLAIKIYGDEVHTPRRKDTRKKRR